MYSKSKRGEIVIKFEILRKKLPCLSENKKSSKFLILESATEYCKGLFENLVLLNKEKLREEKENRNLKEQLGMLLNC